jgi:hypothetical protein
LCRAALPQLNPVSTLTHIAPCCFVFLALPFLYMELPRMVADTQLVLGWHLAGLLLLSATSAFGGWVGAAGRCVRVFEGSGFWQVCSVRYPHMSQERCNEGKLLDWESKSASFDDSIRCDLNVMLRNTAYLAATRYGLFVLFTVD